MFVAREACLLPPGTAVCVGAFDGFHRGHQALLDRARTMGTGLGIVTFDPHPAEVLAPAMAPKRLQSPVQRERVCEALGVDVLVILPFDSAMAALSPEGFVTEFFVKGLKPMAVVTGEDFRFGARRSGGPAHLERLLAPLGIAVASVPSIRTFEPDGPKVSSSAIRTALERGETELAARLLDRWHSVSGTVVRGKGRGRPLGFPTANIHCPDGFLPKPGIYATALSVWDPSCPHDGRVFPAVSSLGKNPTFVTDDDAPFILECHILDQDLAESLYDAQVEVAFIARLRDERRFDHVPALVSAIEADIEAARSHLGAGALARVLRPYTRLVTTSRSASS